MAPIAWSDVQSLPNLPASFASVSVAYQNVILSFVNNDIEVDNLDGEDGPMSQLAREYIAAHLALVGPLAGIKTGTREDDLADTYQLPPIPPGSAFWFTTRYGMAYWQLVQMSAARLPIVT